MVLEPVEALTGVNWSFLEKASFAADVSTVGGAALLPNPHTVCLSEAKAPVSPSDWVGSGGNGGSGFEAAAPLQTCSPIMEISTSLLHCEHLTVGIKADSLGYVAIGGCGFILYFQIFRPLQTSPGVVVLVVQCGRMRLLLLGSGRLVLIIKESGSDSRAIIQVLWSCQRGQAAAAEQTVND